MLANDILKDGSRRLKAGKCGFLFKRLRPSVMYTAITGHDSGRLGDAPLQQIAAEYARFGRPVEWFIEAHGSTSVVTPVTEQWTAWLEKQRQLFKRINVITESKPLHLTIAVARHFSQTERLIVTYDDLGQFADAMWQSAMHCYRPSPTWLEDEPVPFAKSVTFDGMTALSNVHCSFIFKRLNSNSLYSTICGTDNGSLGDEPFDCLESELTDLRGKLTWFVDCHKVVHIDKCVLEDWIYWIMAHESQLENIHMRIPFGAIPLLIEIAKSSHSRVHRMIHLHSTDASFSRAMSFKTYNAAAVC